MTDTFHSQGLAALIAQIGDTRLPPVHAWNPSHCGDSEMRIAADGTWYHQGTAIRRPEMVRLFSTILRREPEGGYVLVTPVEKLDIEVEDAPFVAITAESEGEGRDRRIGFRLNTGDALIAGPDHALRITENASGPRPYVHVRGGLEALISRAVYYDLVEWALAEADNRLGLWSDGVFFAFDMGIDA